MIYFKFWILAFRQYAVCSNSRCVSAAYVSFEMSKSKFLNVNCSCYSIYCRGATDLFLVSLIILMELLWLMASLYLTSYCLSFSVFFVLYWMPWRHSITKSCMRYRHYSLFKVVLRSVQAMWRCRIDLFCHATEDMRGKSETLNVTEVQPTESISPNKLV